MDVHAATKFEIPAGTTLTVLYFKVRCPYSCIKVYVDGRTAQLHHLPLFRRETEPVRCPDVKSMAEIEAYLGRLGPLTLRLLDHLGNIYVTTVTGVIY